MVVADTAAPASSVPVSDVVFLVEGTANFGAYLDTLRSSYILPTLE